MTIMMSLFIMSLLQSQRDFLETIFLSIVDYAKTDHATPEGLVEMLKEDGVPTINHGTLLIAIPIYITLGLGRMGVCVCII